MNIPVFVTTVVLAVLASGVLVAQSDDPHLGTWKLNAAKSKYNPGPAPQILTRTSETQGKGVKVRYEGTAADGSRIDYGYTANYDGKDNPFSGTGVTNGADSVALQRIDQNTVGFTLKKGGKVVLTGQSVVSKDGKVATLTGKGTNANGQPVNVVSVYDKQ